MLAAAGAGAAQAQGIQTIAITQTGPVTCPASGCAPGQTININTTYDLTADHVLVCVYAPPAWNISTPRFSPTGTSSGAVYSPAATPADCGDEAGSTLIGAVQADVSAASGDGLPFSVRLGAAASGIGSITVRTLESAAGSAPWTQTNQFLLPLTVAPSAGTVFVANDAAACGTNTPCYLNSNEDLTGGIGTGLKDAVDASTSARIITILGNYLVKSNTVVIDQPHTLQGLLDSSLTYNGTQCANPLLSVTNGATLRSLNINAGSCTSPARDLINVNSAAAVRIESNDLTGGANAVRVSGGNGAVDIRFNHIVHNSGYAVLRDASGTGLINLVANNLYDNRSGAQVECNLLTSGANHNFWGFGVSAASATLQCSPTSVPLVESKRLGAPALLNVSAAGVQALETTVTTTKTYAFNNAIAVQRTGGSDFSIFIVNHGQGSPENVPFTGGVPNSLAACSNYFDVFNASAAATPTDLSLYLRYDLTAGCTSFVESAGVCGANDSSLVPLWWYDPAGLLTDGWDTTGQNPAGSGAPAGSTGQLTTCQISDKELKVALNNTASQHPNLLTDLNFTPLVVGYRPNPVSIVFSGFSATAGNTQATIRWATANEENITGFYVVRSITENGGYERASILIPRRGSNTSGYEYEFVDSMLTNGQRYYYRIEVITTGGLSSYTAAIAVTPLPPTPTPTVTTTPTVTVTTTGTRTLTVTSSPTVTENPLMSSTPTPTATSTTTLTPTTTQTPTITLTRTRTLTPAPTRTRTRTVAIYPTSVYRSPTPYPSRTFFPTRTATRFGTARTQNATQGSGSGYPAGDEDTPGPGTPSRTPGAGSTVSAYPAEGTTSTEASEGTPGYAVDTPAKGETASGTGTLSGTDTPSGTITPGAPMPSDSQPVQWVKTYWPYLLALLGLELILVAGYGYYLYRKGLLTLPLIRPSTPAGPAGEENEPPGLDEE